VAETTNVVDLLNDLIETAKDGADGYAKASEDVTDPSLKSLFAQFASERRGFVGELQGLVASFGGEPRESGSVLAAAHRGWIDLKSTVATRDDVAILAECQRGDENAVEHYDRAVGTTLPTEVASIVQRQAAVVREAYGRVKGLEIARA
jgi:uncharacterized protein (TIGR02284 family)